MGFANKIRSLISGGHAGESEADREIAAFIAERRPFIERYTPEEVDAMTADAIERAGGAEQIAREAREFREQLKAQARDRGVRGREER